MKASVMKTEEHAQEGSNFRGGLKKEKESQMTTIL